MFERVINTSLVVAHYIFNIRKQTEAATGVLKKFAIFTGKHLCWSFFLIKFRGGQISF